jgi:hypothetical protein
MQRLIPFFIILILIFACRQKRGNEGIVFKIELYPSFHETAQIFVSKSDKISQIRFLLKSRQTAIKRPDTFYFKRILLTESQFERLDSTVIEKIKIKQPHQWTGCCDGMPVEFNLIQGHDTSRLYFRSPGGSDTIGYKITEAAVDNLREIFNDSIINDYLDDIDSYMDNSKEGVRFTDDRAINRLRKIEYNIK